MKWIEENLFLHEVMLKVRRMNHASNPITGWPSKIVYKPKHDITNVTMYLMTIGCIRARRGGGCTMCGYPNEGACPAPVSQDQIVDQFGREFNSLSLIKTPISLRIYNNGSFFDNSELTPDTRAHILRRAAEDSRVVDLRVETLPQFVSTETMYQARTHYPEKRLEVAMGLETANDYFRLLCVNKGFAFSNFQNTLTILNRYCDSAVYLVFKHPFVTEKEAVDDAVYSITRSIAAGAKKVILNPCHIQCYTLNEYLWRRGRFRPPWLWSLIHLVELIGIKEELKFSAFAPSPVPYDHAHNCSQCDDAIILLLKSYPEWRHEIAKLESVNCECREAWRREIRQQVTPLQTRILEEYQRLAKELRVEVGLIPFDKIQRSSYDQNCGTIVFIKPDALQRGLDSEIREALPQQGLRIVKKKRILANSALVKKMYPTMYGEAYIQNVIAYYTEGPMEVLLCSGRDAIQRALKLRAQMRIKYSENEFRNVMHAVDSEGEFLYQTSVLFPERYSEVVCETTMTSFTS